MDFPNLSAFGSDPKKATVMSKTKEKEELDRKLDEMLVGKNPEDILGEQGLLKDIVKRIVERTWTAR